MHGVLVLTMNPWAFSNHHETQFGRENADFVHLATVGTVGEHLTERWREDAS